MITPIIYSGQAPEKLFSRIEEKANVESVVKEIIEKVRNKGDEALRLYTAKFDGFDSANFKVSEKEIEEAKNSLSAEYIEMLNASKKNIETFHKKQRQRGFKIVDGDRIIGQKVTPVAIAGIYVPGGTAAYPSTVLMNAIPAKIAGVKRIVMVTPVKADGVVKAEVLAAASICGVSEIYKVGGAQAIAALAYGTQSIPKCDVITGPGNTYVATAKKLVYGTCCGIDMIAGPSEILVIADNCANPVHVACDMLSQAEHDRLASALLICQSVRFAEAVIGELYRQVELLERRDIALSSLENNCKVIVVDSIDRAIKISNKYAPEHLELCVAKPFDYLKKVKNAGSVFLGYNTPEAVGDYWAGANHTLPTSGTARFSSPLSVGDFTKTTQYVYYSKQNLNEAKDSIDMFATSEGLEAHAKSVKVRFDE